MNRCTLFQGLSLLLLFSALTSCGKDSKNKENERPAVRVKTLAVSNSGVDENRTYSGTVEEGTGTVISFSTAGTIKTLKVSEGDRIAKGQLIGTLDDGSLRNAYDIAKATLEQAKDAYNRMKILHDANSLPDIKWVEVESKLKQAESATEIARIALDDAKLYAPVSGVVSEKMASVGQTAAPGVPVVKIVDINSVKVGIPIPENEISSLSIGMKATITTSSSDGEVYEGSLVEKGVVANPLSRSYVAKFRVDNRSGKLLPGMICDVRLDQGSSVEGVILPVQSVLLAADNSNFVWLDSAGTARKRIVTAGAMLPEGIVITSGLRNGDNVIVEGTDKVSNGTKVESINK